MSLQENIMRNPRETGISSITGMMLTIRHANESEGIDVADIIKRRRGETLDISKDEIVIASQGDQMLGFAVLKKDARENGGCLSLSDGRLQRGISREMLRHLFDYSSVKNVSADRVAARHLIAMGFKRKRGSVRNKEGSVLRNSCVGRGRGSSFIVAHASS
jgi:uncharacterized protein YrrD